MYTLLHTILLVEKCERKNENSIDALNEKERVGIILVGVVGAAARTDPPPSYKHARETWWRGRLAYHRLEVGGGGGGVVGRISRESRSRKVER